MPKKRALCVGINKFKNLPNATLRGCVNDANDMAAMLKEVQGFATDEITVLTDAQATKANIMASLTAMVNDAKAGKINYVVFSFSSHGTQVPDASGDETDRADEAFCPYDLAAKGGQWDPAHIISDDELHDLFVQLPSKVLLEVYMDTCHSGTGLKNIDPIMLLIPDAPKPRYLPPPSMAAFDKLRNATNRGLGDKRKASDSLAKRHILWAGCRDDQTSADATFGGRPSGAFTYFYLQTVRAANGKISRAKIISKVRAGLKKGNFDQVAQLETNATNRTSAPAG